jgi:two-component system KDP operon response regulator KdpE
MADEKVLVIGGDRSARRILHGTLHAGGFAVTDLEYQEDGPALSRTTQFDLILIVAGGESKGIKTCTWLRPQIPRTPIVVLGESDRPALRFKALGAGADDYLAIPIHSEELAARVRAIVLGWRTLSHPATKLITIGEITLDTGRRLVLKAGREVQLTPREFSLLHCLMRNAGSPVLRSALLAEVWGPDGLAQPSNLRVLMRQLRMKLGDAGDSRYLLTDAYVGYRFVAAAKAPGLETPLP